jgi:hypothetical protein
MSTVPGAYLLYQLTAPEWLKNKERVQLKQRWELLANTCARTTYDAESIQQTLYFYEMGAMHRPILYSKYEKHKQIRVSFALHAYRNHLQP